MAFRIFSFFQKDSPASNTPSVSSKDLEPHYIIGISELPEFVRSAEDIPPAILEKIVLNGLIRLEKEGLGPFENSTTKR